MEVEFRIKEVKIPLKAGDVIVFYPQIKQERAETTGRLWWKKTTLKEVWRYFHKIGENIYINTDNSETPIYYEEIDDAQSLIEDYKTQAYIRAKKYWIEKGADWDDERYVKYHKEVEINDKEEKIKTDQAN